MNYHVYFGKLESYGDRRLAYECKSSSLYNMNDEETKEIKGLRNRAFPLFSDICICDIIPFWRTSASAIRFLNLPMSSVIECCLSQEII